MLRGGKRSLIHLRLTKGFKSVLSKRDHISWNFHCLTPRQLWSEGCQAAWNCSLEFPGDSTEECTEMMLERIRFELPIHHWDGSSNTALLLNGEERKENG